MKIKEVSQITGLTEKTIRFYEEKELIHPEQTEINGRIFRNYTDQDVERLNLIAGLRKLEFSISDIAIMQNNPERIPEVLIKYQEKTSADLEFKAQVMERLQQVEFSSVSSIKDLGKILNEIAEDRPLPAADVELQFYKIDGLTKEEMDRAVQNYYEQLSNENKRKLERKITNTVFLYAASVVMAIISGLLIWRNTYYLGYIPSLLDDLGWRWVLLPLFALLVGFISYVIIHFIRNIRKKDETACLLELRSLRRTAWIVLFILFTGIIVSIQSYKSLEKAKVEAAAAARQEWYELYRMTDFVQDYYFDPRVKEPGDNNGLVLYVNQTCYNFPFKYNDRLHTKMYDLLIWSYDLIFKELHYSDSKAAPEEKEQLELLLKEINDELMVISREIIEKPDDELAEMTRLDNKAGDELRSRINEFVDKYTNETEKLFKYIN
ncbi:MAG TPA: MerR family transcriptional regulator [Clostridiales bacterium]|nr:MerR family transcriptional regulator [Clostridiales bacterium]